MELYEKLYKIKTDKNMSYTQLAKNTGVSKSAITSFLTGKNSMYLDNVEKLCNALGLQLDMISLYHDELSLEHLGDIALKKGYQATFKKVLDKPEQQKLF